MTDHPTPREIEEAYGRLVLVAQHMAENAAHIANSRRTLYLAHIAEGFTPEEALVLCQKLNLG